MQKFTVYDFFKRFPDDDACLNHLMEIRFGKAIECPKCSKSSKFHRIKKIPAFECQCGHQIRPMAGTPFESSHTPLQKWFYAMYLFTTSRHGVSAKELQRQLGVTYKTAWRIGHQIRKYMGLVDGDGSLGGHVEIDETYLGGRKKGVKGGYIKNKSIVMGMVERDGKLMTKVVPNTRKHTLCSHIVKNVRQNSTISTDELTSYSKLKNMGYRHGKVIHSIGEYVKGSHHTNSVEGFWSILKRSIKSTHIHVSKKHLKKYLVEFEYRYNMREFPSLMFSRLLTSF